MRLAITGAAIGLGVVMLAGTSTLAEAKCTDGQDRWITVVNNSSRPISRLYMSNSGSDKWGPNLLSSNIRPGQSLDVNADDNSCQCIMDLKAESPRGVIWDRRRYDVCSRTEWNLTD